MSLNNSRYLRVIPSDILVNPTSKIVRYQSLSVQEQIDQLHESIAKINGNMDLLTIAVEKLIDIVEPLKSDITDIPILFYHVHIVLLHFRPHLYLF